ncbi:hypothetical protein BASA82_000471 [Batrachochytrium salamandrivorans]|nr:hypothetical protein BASA81_003391 [Batrachochytrium salamandrivorans]KAH9262468.1 hypothetical protein BASA82_000471 [Batrachochytrium salamandrivorans]
MFQVRRQRVGILQELVGNPVPKHPMDLHKTVEEIVLACPNGEFAVTCSNLGAAISSIQVGSQELTSLPPNWMQDSVRFAGRTCGRLAGRCAKYTLEGFSSANEEPLHGGPVGFSHRVWRVVGTYASAQSVRVCFELESEHMDQGHPGAVLCEVHVIVSMLKPLNTPSLAIRFRAKLAEHSPCPSAWVNLTNHVYFSLHPSATLRLPRSNQYFAQHFDTCAVNVPAKWDYCTQTRPLDAGLAELDHCFMLPQGEAAPETLVAVELSLLGLCLRIKTSFPAVVVYTNPELNGVCFEAQFPPNCPHVTGLLKPLLRSGVGKCAAAEESGSEQNLARRLSDLAIVPREFDFDEMTIHEFHLVGKGDT